MKDKPLIKGSVVDEKRLEWLFKERKYRSWPLITSFFHYGLLMLLYLFRTTFGYWWAIMLGLYILAMFASPSERDVQKEINKELGSDVK